MSERDWLYDQLDRASHTEEAEARAEAAETERDWLLVLVGAAWGVIANAGGGNWENETADWQDAARRWRDSYHGMLHAALASVPPPDADG